MTEPSRDSDALTYFPAPRLQHFCSQCGNRVTYRVPADDTRERALCDQCGAIHYQNPRLVVGTVPVWGDHVLLCRRAIEPRHGYWTLPAGFMELGETTPQGAERETQEEAGARIEMGNLFTMIDVPSAEQVHVFYLARLLDTDFAPGPESLETQLFLEADIPWDDIAFRTVSTTLQLFFEDRRRGSFGMHTPTLAPMRAAIPAGGG
jgi:ADP-ribose pyrophosphatase YjhB (NUDIX family)